MTSPTAKSRVVQVMSILVTLFTLATCTHLLLAQPEGLPGNAMYWVMGLLSLTVSRWLPRRNFDRL